MRTHHSHPHEKEFTMTLILISIGLADEYDLSQKALREARECDILYAELYTTILSTDIERLSTLIGRHIEPLSREAYEESSGRFLEEALEKKVGILVGGDALTATTHISLLLEAQKKKIPAKVIHGSSILTAVAETGLSLYKLGRTVTLPLPEKAPPDTVLQTLDENREQGLHTLILLDLNTETGQNITVNQAIETLLNARRPESFSKKTLTVAVARVGWEDSVIHADVAGNLRNRFFGPPPQVLIVPGNLHFLEAEALKIIGGCPDETLKGWAPRGEFDRLIEKYSKSCNKVVDNLVYAELPKEITQEEVKKLIGHAARYLKDAEYYCERTRKATALASVSYAEGILDALRLLGLVEFNW
jgi:diphthine synthase